MHSRIPSPERTPSASAGGPRKQRLSCRTEREEETPRLVDQALETVALVDRQVTRGVRHRERRRGGATRAMDKGLSR